jgi:hypothetical protein
MSRIGLGETGAVGSGGAWTCRATTAGSAVPTGFSTSATRATKLVDASWAIRWARAGDGSVTVIVSSTVSGRADAAIAPGETGLPSFSETCSRSRRSVASWV